MKSVTSAILIAVLCSGQTTPQFDVASIKPDTSDDRGGNMRAIAGGFSVRSLSVKMLIQSAYNVKPWQISGGPAWMTTDRFDIEAKTAGNPSFQEKLEMFRPLLADRFQLKFHRETRQMTIYSLTVAKKGPKLQATASGVPGYVRPGRGLIEGKGVDMRTLAIFLGGSLGQSVIDNTGVMGGFDIRLEWTPAESESDNKYDERSVDPGGSSVFTAIQEQLGLKLEAGKGTSEVLVIDRVEKPSEN